MSKIFAAFAAALLVAPAGKAYGQAGAGTIADDPGMLTLAVALARTPPPAATAPSADEVGIVELAATVAADALVFSAVPTVRAPYGATPPRVWWTAEAANLPAAIQPGVAYRDVLVRFTLAGRADEIAAMLLDASEAARYVRIFGPARTFAPTTGPMPVFANPNAGQGTAMIPPTNAYQPPAAGYQPTPTGYPPSAVAAPLAAYAYPAPAPAFAAPPAPLPAQPVSPAPRAGIVALPFMAAPPAAFAPPPQPAAAPSVALVPAAPGGAPAPWPYAAGSALPPPPAPCQIAPAPEPPRPGVTPLSMPDPTSYQAR